MRSGWKLLVEGLGMIERAEVEIHPLMLFVGENNSGKSYLAQLLWGLLTLHNLVRPAPVSEAYRAADEWLKRRFDERNKHPSHVLSAPEVELFVRLFNQGLQESKSSLVENVFNASGLSATSIQVSASGARESIELRFVAPQAGMKAPLHAWRRGPFLVTVPELPAADRREILQSLAVRAAMGDLAGLNGGSSRLSYNWQDPVFLPASRTGFMLLYKAVVERQLGQLGAMDAARSESLRLPRPAVHFLQLIGTALNQARGPFADEADFLEHEIHGRVELVSGPGLNDFVYHHAEGKPPLPLYLASSLVTELAPILVVLRHLSEVPVLILEEPEAHLHPRLQRRLAQTIVRLVRKGLHVWVTTHSENFCQQINNFLKIGCHPDRADLQKQLGYGEQDYLEMDDVAAYRFTVEGDRSIVTEEKKTARGLTMPTFNRELTLLTKETLLLQAKTTEHK